MAEGTGGASVPVLEDNVSLPPLLVARATPLPPTVVAVTVTMLVAAVVVTLVFGLVPVPKQGEAKHCPEFALMAACRFSAVFAVLPATMRTSLALVKAVTNLYVVGPGTVGNVGPMVMVSPATGTAVIVAVPAL